MRILVKPPEIPHDHHGPQPIPERSFGTGARVWLVRHAEVHSDWQQRAYGGLDVPLSPQGESETAAMGRAFESVRVATVACSHLSRARAMGTAIANATGANLIVDARLREVSRGNWQGLPAAEFSARWHAESANFLADPWNWKGHGGESDAEIFARAWEVVSEVVRATGHDTVVIASHYNVIRALATRMLGLRPHESFAFRTDTSHAALFQDDAAGWKLLAANVADPRAAEVR